MWLLDPLPPSKYQICSPFYKLHQMEKSLKQFQVHRIRLALLLPVAFVLFIASFFFKIFIEFVNWFVARPKAFVVHVVDKENKIHVFYFQALHSQVSQLQLLGPQATVVMVHTVDHRHQGQILMASPNQGHNPLMVQHQVFYKSNRKLETKFCLLAYSCIQTNK